MNFVLTEHFSNLFISSAALTLIHFLWQGALVALLLRFLLALTPQKLIKARYRLAVFALLLTVAMPSVTFYYLMESPELVQSTVNYSSQIIQILKDNSSQVDSLKEVLNESMLVGTTPGEFITSYVSKNQTDILLNILIVWLLGCIFMLVKLVVDLNKTYKLAKNGIAPINEQIDKIVCHLVKSYGLSNTIRVFKSSLVNVPVVIGWLKPVILLPIAITVGLEKQQLELIIAHELAHIKRMDFAVNVVQSVVQLCLFYHPAVYWINRVIRDEREFICDEMALNVVGNNDLAKLNLAKALLNTEELRDGNFSLIAVAASGGKLRNRISHILDVQYRAATSIKTILVGLTAFAFSIVAMASTIAFDKSYGIEKKNTVVDLGSLAVEHPLNTRNISFISRAVEPVLRKGVSLENHDAATIENPNQIKPSSYIVSNSNQADTNQNFQSRSKQSKVAKAKGIQDINSLKSKMLVLSKIDNTVSKTNLKSEVFNDSEATVQLIGSAKQTVSAGTRVSLFKNSNDIIKIASLDLNNINAYSEPKAIYTPYPKYPRRAWSKMINQTVRVKFVIDDKGNVREIKTIGKVDKDFAREIRNKLKRWRYEPAINNGQNIEHASSLDFVFRAPQKEKVILTVTGSRIRR